MGDLVTYSMLSDQLTTEMFNRTAYIEWFMTHPIRPWMLGFLYPITVVGTFGNFLVIAAILAAKELRTSGNMFILNLAAADICVSLFVNGFNIVGVYIGGEWFEERMWLCYLIGIVCITSCSASLMFIGLVGVNRYIHICKHEVYDKIFTFKKTVLMCIFTWIFSFFVLESPNVWPGAPGGHRFEWKAYYCAYDRSRNPMWNMFFTLVLFGTPLLLTMICYVKIFRHVNESNKKIAAMSAQTKATAAAATSNSEGNNKVELSKKQRNDSTRLARTLFIVFIVFVITYAPWSAIIAFDWYDQIPMEIYASTVLLGHLNSCVNWILYGITNRQFRRAYVKVLCLEKCFPATAGKASTTANSGQSASSQKTQSSVVAE